MGRPPARQRATLTARDAKDYGYPAISLTGKRVSVSNMRCGQVPKTIAGDYRQHMTVTLSTGPSDSPQEYA